MREESRRRYGSFIIFQRNYYTSEDIWEVIFELEALWNGKEWSLS
jgi:hypothetical protein